MVIDTIENVGFFSPNYTTSGMQEALLPHSAYQVCAEHHSERLARNALSKQTKFVVRFFRTTQETRRLALSLRSPTWIDTDTECWAF